MNRLIFERLLQRQPRKTCLQATSTPPNLGDLPGGRQTPRFKPSRLIRDSGVPGELRGLKLLHQKYGSLPWVDLVLPSVEVARNGFRVTNDLAAAMDSLGPSSFLSTDSSWAIDFAPNGTRLGQGDIMTRKRYADFLELIAHDGPDAFYRGWIATTTVAAIRAANGIMSMDDLSSYTVIVRPPVEISYRDYRILSCGTPSSGIVTLHALKVVETYTDMGDPSAVNLSTHRLDQATRFAFGAVSQLSVREKLILTSMMFCKRTKLGDPSFIDHMELYQQELLSDATIRTIRSKISDEQTLPISSYNPDKLESPRRSVLGMWGMCAILTGV